MLRLLTGNILDRRNFVKTLKLREISELKTGPFGTQFSAKEYVSEGIPVINVKNIGYGNIISEGLDYVGNSTLERLSEHKLKTGDIVFGRKGSVDRHCLITKEQDGWMQGSDCIRVRLTDASVYSNFISYYLLTDAVKTKINNSAVGSTMASLNTDILGDVDINLPGYEEQYKIASVLSTIDQKIEKNKEINDYLYQMAKTIYDYWFVQFDFPDKNGKPYKSSGGTLKNGLPIGWNYVPIKNICNILSGFSFQSDDYVQNGKYKLLTIKNVQDTGINLDVDNYINILPENMPDFCKLDIGSILMSLTGNVGRVGILYDSNCLLNQRVSLMQAKNPIVTPFIYCLLKSSKMRYILESLATGTSQKNLSPIEAGNIMIPYDSEIVKNFSKKVTPLIDSIITNLKENNNLTNLREWLLPMLMNGQATIEN